MPITLKGASGDTSLVSAVTGGGAKTLTLPDVTDTVVTKTSTDTLTNKTLTGATFTAMPATTTAQSMVRLNTANGYGSTNTKIRRFTNTVTNQGSDITYADSATLGATFTINTNGVYAISYSDSFTGAASYLGISLNSSQLTTSITSVTIADVLVYQITSAADNNAEANWAGYLASGSVIRAHTNGVAVGTNAQFFTITRVA